MWQEVEMLDQKRFTSDFSAMAPGEVPEPLVFLKRTPFVHGNPEPTEPAEKEEWRQYLVHEQARRFPQSFLHKCVLLQRGAVADEDLEGTRRFLWGFRNQLIADLHGSLLQAANYAVCQMQIGGETYPGGPRFFIHPKQNWTAATRWKNHEFASPVENVLGIAADRYDRMTIGRADFRDMTMAREFGRELQRRIRDGEVDASLSERSDFPSLVKLASQMFKLQVEIHDTTFRGHDEVGGALERRVQPEGVLIFSNTAHDHDPAVMDFFMPVLGDDFYTRRRLWGMPRPHAGPLGWIRTNLELNPPDVTAHAALCAGPRRHDVRATAVLRV